MIKLETKDLNDQNKKKAGPRGRNERIMSSRVLIYIFVGDLLEKMCL